MLTSHFVSVPDILTHHRISKLSASYSIIPFCSKRKAQSFFAGDSLEASRFCCDDGESKANRRKGGSTVRARAKLAQNLERTVEIDGGGDSEKEFDAIVIGSGIGGLVASTQLAVKGARVLVLEKYVIPGGSSGFYQRDGYTFDVGSSVMFGFSDKVSFAPSFLFC